MYGLAKVHKSGVPLRPVVSMVGTPQYQLSKYLDKLIRPYMSNKYSVSSTYDLIDKMNKLSVSNHTYMVSYDITSLFTNVPVQETIDIICNTVCHQPGFPYNHKDLKTLLTIANESIFVFSSKLYKQIDGISMGNPLAPLLAEFFMGYLEDKVFNTNSQFYPQYYFRYVDDTLCFFDNESHANEFLTFLNTIHPNIRFTIEKSVQSSIPFLDIKLTIVDNLINTEVFRKPTFTACLLNFKSIVPRQWKIALIKTLVYRAYRLSSSWSAFDNEIKILKDILTFNNFPYWWLERHVRAFLNAIYSGSYNHRDREDNNYIVIKIPYYGYPSFLLKRRINRILRQFHNTKVKICFTIRRLRTVFPIKDKTPTYLQSSIIYKFECSGDPNISYVGETGRQVIRRVKDHATGHTAVTEHLKTCYSCNKDTLIENFKILHKATDYYDRVIKEALFIQKIKPVLNTQCTSGKRTYSLQLF